MCHDQQALARITHQLPGTGSELPGEAQEMPARPLPPWTHSLTFEDQTNTPASLWLLGAPRDQHRWAPPRRPGAGARASWRANRRFHPVELCQKKHKQQLANATESVSLPGIQDMQGRGNGLVKKTGALVFLFLSSSNNNNDRSWKKGQTVLPPAPGDTAVTVRRPTPWAPVQSVPDGSAKPLTCVLWSGVS